MAETSLPADGSTRFVPWFVRVYQEEESRLMAEARKGTGPEQPAEDTVAEAAFQVWRRLAADDRVTDLAGELTAALRAGRAVPVAECPPGAQVPLLARILEETPARQVTAVWLVEVEGLPLVSVGHQLQTHRNAAAILLHRARENMRQRLLQAQQGEPQDETCRERWQRMPARIRGVDSSADAAELGEHTQHCADCRQRLARLAAVDERLHLLVGPALVALLAHERVPYLIPAIGAGRQSAADGLPARSGNNPTMPLRFVKHLADRAFGSSPTLVGVTLAGVFATQTLSPREGRGNDDALAAERDVVPAARPTGGAGKLARYVSG